jgi:DNA replication and repair protein RecF
VRLSGLGLRHFRNLGSQDLEIPPEGVAIIGDNAQGKSNLLEAIYYLETFRSFRGARDEQLVTFGEDVFRVAGTVEGCEEGGVRRSHEVAAAFQRRDRRKKVTLDGTEPNRLGEALGRLGAVIFSPADVELVSGGPVERRRFLDVVLSLNEPGYLASLQDYRRILTRRNAALKDAQSGAAVGAWNPGLLRAGAEVMRSRQSWIASRSGAFGEYYRRVSDEGSGRMEYRPSVRFDATATGEGIEAAFREALMASCERERRVASTVVGPHRDDVLLRLDRETAEDLDLREYGSGGQRRTAALALRLVEARTIREARGRRPLILLDDVFAELDAGRSERVLRMMEMEETGQVVLTAPREDDVRLRKDTLPRWRIDAGRIAT